MNIIERPDGTWITGKDVREWYEEVHSSATVAGHAIPQNIDPTPLVNQKALISYLNFREFDFASVGESLHPNFAESPLDGKLGSPPDRFMDPSLQVESMSTQAQLVTYVQHFMHCVRTIQREQMAADKNGFKPQEFFSFPTIAGVNGMFTMPPNPVSLSMIADFTQRSYQQRMLIWNSQYLERRPKVFDNYEFSAQTEHHPIYAISPSFPFQEVIASVGKHYEIDLARSLLWTLGQERVFHDNRYVFYKGRIDALTVVTLRLQQALIMVERFVRQLRVEQEVERTMMRSGWYYQMRLHTNPLLSEGQVNYLVAVRHVLLKYGLHPITDLIDHSLFHQLPDPGLIRILVLLGFFDWRIHAQGDSPIDVTNLVLLINFQRKLFDLSTGKQLQKATKFLYDHQMIVGKVFMAECYFPRRPTATDRRSFKELFFEEQARLTPKNPFATEEEELINDDEDMEYDDFLCTPGVAENL